MWGWLSRAATWISRWNRSPSSALTAGRKSLRAISRLWRMSRASSTTAIPPRPSSDVTAYRSATAPAKSFHSAASVRLPGQQAAIVEEHRDPDQRGQTGALLEGLDRFPELRHCGPAGRLAILLVGRLELTVDPVERAGFQLPVAVLRRRGSRAERSEERRVGKECRSRVSL